MRCVSCQKIQIDFCCQSSAVAREKISSLAHLFALGRYEYKTTPPCSDQYFCLTKPFDLQFSADWANCGKSQSIWRYACVCFRGWRNRRERQDVIRPSLGAPYGSWCLQRAPSGCRRLWSLWEAQNVMYLWRWVTFVYLTENLNRFWWLLVCGTPL
jgi:hypothetical protein